MQMSVIDSTLKQIDGRWQIHQESSTRGTQQAKQESTKWVTVAGASIYSANRSPAATELLLPLIRMTTPNKIPSRYKSYNEKCIAIFHDIKCKQACDTKLLRFALNLILNLITFYCHALNNFVIILHNLSNYIVFL